MSEFPLFPVWGRRGQVHRDMGSFPQFAANNKLAAVSLRNQSAQIQSKPETPGVTLSGTVGTVKRFTDLVEMFLGNPFPGL